MQSATKRRSLFIVLTLLVIAGAYAFARANSGWFKMPNAAMEPTLKTGEVFFVDMMAYKSADPQRWDVVVFQSPKNEATNWVFRVVGLPGETISFDDDGLLVDGRAVALPHGIADIEYSAAVDGKESIVVQADSYFLLGDNPAKANDSRFWGTVSRDEIVGRVNEDAQE